MKNTVCVTLFKTLSESEVREFGNYLTSSYQKSGSVYKLYKHLRRYHPGLTNERLERKYVEKKLFGDKANPERTLFDNTSKLTAKLKNFITIQELEKQEVYKNFLYLEALKSRKLDILFFRKAESLQKEWEDDSIPGIEHFHNQYKLKVLNYSHPNFSNEKIKKTSELRNSIDILEQYYSTTKMYYTLINEINNKKAISEKYTVRKLLDDFDSATFSESKAKTKLLHHLLLAYQSNDIVNFKEVKFNFFNLHHQFHQSEKHDIVSILNYLFYSKRNDIYIYDELFEITKFSLKEGLLFEDGYLTNQSFVNCILFAKANNSIEWIEKFIRQYKEFLNKKNKNDYIEFGEIILLVEKSEFENALEKLAKIKLRAPARVAQLNCCRLQCFYEMEYEEAFFNSTNSASQYLLNHKKDLQEEHLFMIKNFISATKDIYKLKIEKKLNSKEKGLDFSKVLEKISQVKNSPYKKWLIAKVKEIRDVN